MREQRAETFAAEVSDHPWFRPESLGAARAAYLAAYERAGQPPLRLAEREPVDATRRRLRGARVQTVWDAARFDPGPEIRTEALLTGVAFVRDKLVSSHDCALYGPVSSRDRPALRAAGRGPVTPWAYDGPRWTGPLHECGHVLLVGSAHEPFAEGARWLQAALDELIADAASVGFYVEDCLDGIVEIDEGRPR